LHFGFMQLTVLFMQKELIFLYVLSVDHQMDDLPVCLEHTLRCQFAHTADRIFHAFFHDTVASDKLLSVLIHKVTKDSRIYGGRDLCCTGCFRSVADHT